MGFFSTRKVHHTGTTISRLLEDKDLVDSTKSALTSALLRNEDPVDALIDIGTEGIAASSRTYYNYGKSTYVHGLPTGEVFYNSHGRTEVETILSQIEGTPVVTEYVRFGPMNGIHMGWSKLVSVHGYKTNTNRLSNLEVAEKLSVYMTNMQLELPVDKKENYDASALEVFGKPPSAVKVPNAVEITFDILATGPAFVAGITSPQVRVYWYAREEDTTKEFKEKKGSFTIPVSEMVPNTEYYYASYTVNGVRKFFQYLVGTGEYPSLDKLTKDGGGDREVFGEFYPNIYFRLNKQKLSTDTNSDQYKHSSRMMKLFGLSYQEVSEQIHMNPQIGDVDSALMTLAVDATSTDIQDAEYLYTFFERAYEADEFVPKESSDPLNDLGLYLAGATPLDVEKLTVNRRAIKITDKSKFESTLTYGGITKSVQSGKLSNGKEFQVEVKKVTYSYNMDVVDGVPAVIDTPINHYIYRKQLGLNTFAEIQVIDLTMKYVVAGDRLSVQGDADKEIILIPLDSTIVDKIPFRKKERLIQRSLQFVFNSHVIQNVRWYQTASFATFIKIVGIVLIAFGIFGPQGLIAEALFSVAEGALGAFVLETLGVLVGVSVAVKYVVKTLGFEKSLILALVAAAIGAYQWVAAGSNGTFVLTAKQYIQLATNLAKGVSQAIAKELSNLMGEMEEFSKKAEEELKLLEDDIDNLNPTASLIPMVLFGESPSSFYQRTVHTGNIGTLVFDEIHTYVDRSLKLPTFNESYMMLGGTNYFAEE